MSTGYIDSEMARSSEATEEADRLTKEHWDYLAQTLSMSLRFSMLEPDQRNDLIANIQHHFTTAFIHGFKHGVEYATDVKARRDESVQRAFEKVQIPDSPAS